MNSLDKLGLAIADAGYACTPEMREAYEAGYENGVIDGMQKQMESNVDKAVRAMAERVKKQWVGLTDEEQEGFIGPVDSYETLERIEAKLKEKNT